jgi:hypothetical protein
MGQDRAFFGEVDIGLHRLNATKAKARRRKAPKRLLSHLRPKGEGGLQICCSLECLFSLVTNPPLR